MSNSILPAAGNLDIVNAKVRADKFEATTSIGVSNTNPDFDLSVGTRFHVDKDSVDPVSVTGNVVASGIKISNLTISPAFDFAAVSNVGNTTSNTLQFANATTSFVASSNVEIGGNITLTSNAQVKVGSNVLAEYTGPHGREPKEMPLKKYPEIAFDASKLDGNDTTNTYVQAGYTVTSSSVQSGYAGHEAFNGKINTELDAWRSLALYTTGTGAYSVSTNSVTALDAPSGTSTTYNGEWLQIQMPKSIKLSHFVLHSQGHPTLDLSSRLPGTGVMVGSTDGSTWYLLKRFVNLSHRDKLGTKIVVDTNTTSYYKYFRILAEKTSPNGSTYDTDAAIGELEYYGYEEPAPPGDLSLDTTLKSTFNSVRSNNYVMYFDGKDPAAGNVPKNLVNDSSISITPHNAVFDTTNNCWTLDGSTESNVTTGSLGFEGDVPHTVSTWINASNLEANALTQQLFSIGSGYDKAFLKVDDTQIAANTWHNVTYAYQGEGGSKVTYVDGRKVEEAQVEDTFGVYPRFGMTGYKTGGYCVSASSEYENSNEYPAWQAFDHDTTTNGNQWICATGLYENNGTYTGTTSTVESSNTWTGEYLQLELPYKIRVSDVQILREINVTYGTSRSPNTGAILGSNDGYNWSYILNFTNKPHTDYTDTVFSSLGTSSGTDSYKYLRLVVTKIQDESVTSNSNGNLISICEIRYYGHKEGDLTRFPEPTRVLKYPHIAMTGPAQRGYVASASSLYLSGGEAIFPAWEAFDRNTSVYTRWASENAQIYNGGSFLYSGSKNLGTNNGGSGTENGEWLMIEMPHKLKLQSTKLIANGNALEVPDKFIIYGSNDLTGAWSVVDNTYETTSAAIPSGETGKTWTVSTSASPVAYKYFGLVVRNTTGSTYLTTVNEWELYGTEEDTGTPAIVGGPFAGKVANFRVYDKYLGDERIQEIYDAQKDEFGHKKSSMTFYKGRIGVGTTEPEGALTVIDEPHALAKFPARAVSADDSYVEGDGQIKLSAADGSGYQAFDGLTSTSWTATPTRNTRVSEEVDFGAWLKIQTPESMSLKKAEIESRPDWRQVGGEIQGSLANDHFGRSVACSHDGTRVIAGGFVHSGDQGMVRVYDWNGSAWELIGNQTITGTADNDQFARHVAISGDGNIIAIAAPYEHIDGSSDLGAVRVYYLVGSTWTLLPDSGLPGGGSLTKSSGDGAGGFVGTQVNSSLGLGMLQLSYDGKTIAMCEYGYDDDTTNDVGRVLVYQYSNGAWSYKGTGATQFVGDTANAHFGFGLSMSEDGNHLAIGTYAAGWFVEVYTWDGSAWGQKGSRINQPSTSTGANDNFGSVVSVSNDGNTLAIGAEDADLADGALADNSGLVFVYHWTGSAWGTPHKLTYNKTDNEAFGTGVVLSGDGKRLVVSAPDQPVGAPTGELFTFEYTGGSWIMRTPGVQGLDGDATDQGHLGWGWHLGGHGFALSRDGSTIVAGELGDDGGGINAGRVRVFNMPSNIKSIWGSNDDVNWTRIVRGPTREEATSNVAGLAFGYDDRLEFKNLDNPNYYKYHAIVADAFTQLKDVKLFGVRNQGSSTLHDGALTLTKNLDVPRIGPPLDADDTPRRDRLVVEYNTHKNPMEDGLVKDASGRGNDGAFYGGAYYDASAKALEFDGNADNISGTIPSISGEYVHSISLWVKIKDALVYTLFEMGARSTDDLIGISISSSTINYYFYSNDNSYTGITPGSWQHLTFTYSGGSDLSNRKLYVNGEEISRTTHGGASTGALTLANGNFTIGDIVGGTASNDFKGSISQFKLYDTALTAEEVKTLYDMGRMGSVANPKTLQIASSLDVRGQITREYYPGEVIEELHAVCDRTSLRGKAVIQNVNTYQNLSTSYADATGSRVENYIIPKGTTNIVYEYSFHVKFGDAHGISHWRLYYQVNSGGWEEVTKARMDVAGQYYDEKKIVRWVFEVGGAENVPFGIMDAKAGDSVDFRWYVREYSSENEIVLHLSQYWDGGQSDIYSQPTIMIKAIA
jgi:hypothetical protein